MSCSAWRRLVQPDIMKPMSTQNSDRNFIKWRTVAVPKEILSPSELTTCSPSKRLPMVARQEELSKKSAIQPRPNREHEDEGNAGHDLGVEGGDPKEPPKAFQENVNREGKNQRTGTLDGDVDGACPYAQPEARVLHGLGREWRRVWVSRVWGSRPLVLIAAQHISAEQTESAVRQAGASAASAHLIQHGLHRMGILRCRTSHVKQSCWLVTASVKVVGKLLHL